MLSGFKMNAADSLTTSILYVHRWCCMVMGEACHGAWSTGGKFPWSWMMKILFIYYQAVASITSIQITGLVDSEVECSACVHRYVMLQLDHNSWVMSSFITLEGLRGFHSWPSRGIVPFYYLCKSLMVSGHSPTKAVLPFIKVASDKQKTVPW